jgi:hypothetical protein
VTITTGAKWLALIATLSGAVFTSLQITPLNIYLLNFGSVLYLIWSIRVRDLNLILVNSGLVLIYVVGVVKLLLT